MISQLLSRTTKNSLPRLPILAPLKHNTASMSALWTSLFADPFYSVDRIFLPSTTNSDSGSLVHRPDSGNLHHFRGPKLDVLEGDQQYTITGKSQTHPPVSDLPGLTKQDIQLVVDDGMLTIKGERKTERDEHRGKTHIVERSFGQFSRSVRTPPDAEVDKATAHLENGVLRLELPKKQVTQEQPKTIDIK
ncbi:hypothetical protein HKX48_008285 [Thoreauomyces humboldtii]|nr:hypothetical protein HKX48_008285 [Thoreauomyces humboldtii]